MNTSKYDPETRKQLKRFQRTSAYQVMKAQHQQVKQQLETKLLESKSVIDKLTAKLATFGVSPDELAKIAA